MIKVLSAAAVLGLAGSAFGAFTVNGLAYDNVSVSVTGGNFVNAGGYLGFEYANGWVAQNTTRPAFPGTYAAGTWHAIHTGEAPAAGAPVTADSASGLIIGNVVGAAIGNTLGPGGTGPLGFNLEGVPAVPSAPTNFPELGGAGEAVFLGRYTVDGGTIAGTISVAVPQPGDDFATFGFDVDSTAGAPVFNGNGSGLGLYLRDIGQGSFDIYLTDIPTPGAAALLGVAGLAGIRRRRA